MVDVLLVVLEADGVPWLTKWVLGADEYKATDEHTGADADIGYNTVFYVLVMVDVRHEFSGDVGGSHVLFEVEFLLLSKLKVVHVL